MALILPAPRALAEEPAGPVPPGYHRVTRPRHPLVWGGASVLALSYLVSSYVATTSYPDDDGKERSSRHPLWVPLAGPFLTLDAGRSTGENTALVLDGLVQCGGLALMIYGLVVGDPVLLPDAPDRPARVSIQPLLGRGGTGASLVVTF